MKKPLGISLYTTILITVLFIISCNKMDSDNSNSVNKSLKDSNVNTNDSFKKLDEHQNDIIPRVKSNNWKKFKGAYFSINYPDNFIVKPSINYEGSNFDSVFLISPDESVEFYVYSPLWNGEATDIDIDNSKESIISDESNVKNNIKIKHIMIEAKDKSYNRTYVYSENLSTNNLTVFGIKYKTKDDYNFYLNDYLKFKKSIEQFADGE